MLARSPISAALKNVRDVYERLAAAHLGASVDTSTVINTLPWGCSNVPERRCAFWAGTKCVFKKFCAF